MPDVAVESARENRESVEVTASRLPVYDQPRTTSYLTDTLKLGAQVTVRQRVAGGWLAIDPPSSAICWIDSSSLEQASESARSGHHFGDRPDSNAEVPSRSWVAKNRVELRSGHASAQLPGPPCGSLSQGTMVHLVDRPPIKVGRGKASTTWYAILPPAGLVRYVRAEGTRPVPSRRVIAAERLAAYEPTQEDLSAVRKRNSSDTQVGQQTSSASEDLPPGIASEIAQVDAMHRAILSGQPIEQWHFETVRARYQAILKRAGASAQAEEVIRERLARLTRHEQAAGSARTIQTILARSHRRDSKVAAAEGRHSATGTVHARAFTAEGLVKPTANMVDGRRLYSLIGADGQTVAYLDVPPGLDIEPLMTRRIGVRGATHYSEDLGARLITVRDVEAIDTRR
jgi:hypothetical protein